jgi:phosphatidylglycerol:prolipoprotein diacylglycerol transferase
MSAIAFTLGPLTVRWYGILIVTGIILAILLAGKLAAGKNMKFDDLTDIALVAVPLGILCARAYYVIFSWDYYAANPSEIIAIWHGGLAIHGGIIGGALALLLVSRHKRQAFRSWADVIAPGLILAQSIGRWGNYFNQEAYGYETDLPWAFYIDGAYRHPTFLYESLWDLAGCLLLLCLWRLWRDRKTGDIAACYLIYYSLGRFVIEHFRTDSLMLGPLQMAQVISIIGIIGGLLLFWYNRKFPVLEAHTKISHVKISPNKRR